MRYSGWENQKPGFNDIDYSLVYNNCRVSYQVSSPYLTMGGTAIALRLSSVTAKAKPNTLFI